MEIFNKIKRKILIKLSKVDSDIIRRADIEITDDLLSRMLKIRTDSIKSKFSSIFNKPKLSKIHKSVVPKIKKPTDEDLVNAIQKLINDMKWMSHKYHDLQQELQWLKDTVNNKVNVDEESPYTEETSNLMVKSNMIIRTQPTPGGLPVLSEFQ